MSTLLSYTIIRRKTFPPTKTVFDPSLWVYLVAGVVSLCSNAGLLLSFHCCGAFSCFTFQFVCHREVARDKIAFKR